jgi:hypothetical protein
MFYYQEMGIEVGMVVSLGKTYLSFWVSKTPWQREMMIEDGRQRGVNGYKFLN